jgi:hypothetical protein
MMTLPARTTWAVFMALIAVWWRGAAVGQGLAKVDPGNP